MANNINHQYNEDSNLSDTFICENHKKENGKLKTCILFIYDDIGTSQYNEGLFY